MVGAFFIESFVNGIRLKSGGRAWYLEFGILFHKMIEEYYTHFREPGFDAIDWAVKQGAQEWKKMDMDFHKDHKEYKTIGGFQGLAALLLSYAATFSKDNERLRVIGTEIGFGKNKEVPLGLNGGVYFYLSGRIDLLVDDGVFICPVDHKTMGTFRRNPTAQFEIDEGPTGYVYAVSRILRSIVPEELYLRRKCNKIQMNFISKTPVQPEANRFQRVPLFKTEAALENYNYRQLATGKSVFETLLRYFLGYPAMRDTSKCTNWYNTGCHYLPIHRQQSVRDEEIIKNSLYQIQPIWDTETVGKEKGDADERRENVQTS